MSLTLILGVACAILFVRAAQYERMSPWTWGVASLGLTAAISMRSGSITLLLVAQAALFVVMWWYNARRQDGKPR